MRLSYLAPGAAWLAAAASARSISRRGTTLWDGRELTSTATLDEWSFSNPVGPYQYYIHGPGETTAYVNLSPDFKNPADTASEQGIKITLDDTAYWNGQNMRRTELIPQTTAAINAGHVYYHFSIKRSDVNAPSTTKEHQIAFFESHFTELKAGWLSGSQNESDPNLRWMVGGVSQWNVEWEADVWHNVAYDIDFDAGTVGFWHSTGSDALVQVVEPMSASTSSNGADWHVGVLELPRDGYPAETEDFYFSGVYIESGPITTSVGSGASSGGEEPAPEPSNAIPAAPSSAAPAPSSVASAVTSAAPSAVTSAPVVEATSAAEPIASSPAAVPTSAAPIASPVTTSSAAPVLPSTTAIAPSAPSSAAPAAPTTSAGAGVRPCKRSKKKRAALRKARAAGRR
ncbi:hypothetical protein S7711_11234 [Stachybotrys chartarum IBT 7711]|uniref:Glycoside hydrolase 131 catalytic N-terminal domain-containing protein n=1 Tax=Stachybotrys chartarum (strain CBS 109288 / IBT 7711) TaxID=1280523 RepID=A0A084AQM5_STACB|nr:hypothetical protein S7711_11234 [Stachybotrys chartarum IBT 7711]KFA56228.1 hypothetical protein S40293_10352 [Stachybotrys chartarum IBT 40293]